MIYGHGTAIVQAGLAGGSSPCLAILIRLISLLLCLIPLSMARIMADTTAMASSGSTKRSSPERFSLFLLGDSTSAALIKDGLRSKCNTTITDPRAVKVVEWYNRSGECLQRERLRSESNDMPLSSACC